MILDWLAACAMKYPYLGRAIFALRPIERAGALTLAVDRSWRLYWSPSACMALQAAGGMPYEMIRHEVEHLLRDHDGRRGSRDHGAWNIAGDMEINDDLEASDMPAGICLPKVYGLTAEEYYPSVEQCPCCGGGSGTGNPIDGELPDDEQSDPAVADAVRDTVAADIRSTPGDVPGGLRIWAEARMARLRERINPMQVARRTIRELAAGRQDYSYARPNKRQQDDSVVLPATVRSRRQLAVVVDTSGSMATHGDWVAGVLACVIRDCSTAVMIDCDCAVHQVRRLRSWRDARSARGGGGTDMRIGVSKAVALAYRNILLVTDGETPWPSPWPRGLIALLPDGTRRHG